MMLPKANAKSLKTIGDSKKEGEVNQDVPVGYEMLKAGDARRDGYKYRSIGDRVWVNGVHDLNSLVITKRGSVDREYCAPIITAKSKRPSPPEGYRFARIGEPYGPDFWEYPKDTNYGRKKEWTHTVYTKDGGTTFTLDVLKFWYVAVPIKAAPENATVTPEQVAMAVKYGESLGLVSEPPQLPDGYTLAGEGHVRSRATMFKMKDSPNDAWSLCKPEGIGKPISDKSAAKVWYAIPVVNVAYFQDLPKDADAPEGYRWAEEYETKGVVLVEPDDGSIIEWRQCGNQPPMYFSYDRTGDNPFCRPAIKKVTKEEVEAARREFVAARESSNKAFIEYLRLEGEYSIGR